MKLYDIKVIDADCRLYSCGECAGTNALDATENGLECGNIQLPPSPAKVVATNTYTGTAFVFDVGMGEMAG